MISLVSFADSRLKYAKRRLRRQAWSMGIFDTVTIFDESGLSPDFRFEFERQLQPGVRGFGYWCWKPQVIIQTLSRMKPGAVLVYVDAGCHLNWRGAGRMRDYLDIVRSSEQGVLGFDFSVSGNPVYRESAWTKGSVFEHFNLQRETPLKDSAQICATAIVVHKTAASTEFVNDWRQLLSTHFTLFDDSPSPWNYEDFQENRHDQSVFSIMGKLRGITLLSHAEQYPFSPDGQETLDWKSLEKYPVHARRDKFSPWPRRARALTTFARSAVLR